MKLIDRLLRPHEWGVESRMLDEETWYIVLRGFASKQLAERAAARNNRAIRRQTVSRAVRIR